jgi:hypothetical protein
MEPHDATSTSARAQELRASLGTRRQVEALLAEASATREAAVTDADAVIEEAQQLSAQLVRESRAEAELTSAAALEQAEAILGRARTEAEDIARKARSAAEDVAREARAAADAVRARAEAQVEEHRRRVRAELTEQVTREVAEQNRRELALVEERQQAMIGDLEASVRILGVSLEAAGSTIGELLGALDSLRVHTAESLGDTTIPTLPPPPRPADELFRNTTQGTADPASGHSGTARHSGAPVHNDTSGSIFDSPAPAESIPAPRSAFDAADELSIEEFADQVDPDELDRLDEDSNPPLTATEAYLRSAHLDHDDPLLTPTDDTDVGARYARDAMRATARGRVRRDEETLDVVPERSAGQDGSGRRAGPDERDQRVAADAEADEADEADDASGKPLGWLFRSS